MQKEKKSCNTYLKLKPIVFHVKNNDLYFNGEEMCYQKITCIKKKKKHLKLTGMAIKVWMITGNS